MFGRLMSGGTARALAAAVLLLAAWPGKAPAQEPGPAAPAAIRMGVPEGAEVWVDGARTRQTGVDRSFVTPPLDPGRTYSYAVRVRWVDGDGTAERTRTVRFRAGEQLALYFRGAGFLEVHGYAASEDPLPSLAPAVPAAAPSPAYPVPAAPEPPRPYRGYFERGGPPGSNSPLSLGVGNG
jgi:uncharacterized protein (TIGR03000 family)